MWQSCSRLQIRGIRAQHWVKHLRGKDRFWYRICSHGAFLRWESRELHESQRCIETYIKDKYLHTAWGPEIMASWLQDIHAQLQFSPKATRILVHEWRPKSRSIVSVNICNAIIKQGGKNADGKLGNGHQVSFMTQENLDLAAFLFHQRWSWAYYWEVTQIQEGKAHKLTGHKSSRMSTKTQICCLMSIRQGQWKPSKCISDHVMVSREHVLLT